MRSRAWVVVLMAGLATRAGAQDREEVQRDVGSDHFARGGNVRVSTPVSGDLIAAGGDIETTATVEGDAVLAGGDLRVDGRVGQDLYAAAGDLTISGVVSRNARIAGGQVLVGSGAQMMGNVTAAGGEISIEGPVDGYVQARGGRVYINASVGGDVEAKAGEIELGPNARIAGTLRYASDDELIRAPQAQVQGGVERMPGGAGWPMLGQMGMWSGWLWALGFMLLAALLVALLPGFSASVASTLRGSPGKSLLFGVAALIGIPIVVFLLMATLVGIPVALVGIALYFVLLLVGYVSAGVALGDWALDRFRPDDAGRTGWRVVAAIIAVLVIGLAALIPVIGGIVVLAAMLTGIGALVLQARRQPAVV